MNELRDMQEEEIIEKLAVTVTEEDIALCARLTQQDIYLRALSMYDCERQLKSSLAANREQKAEIERLKGIIKADDERLLAASESVGIPSFGCDTADHLAEEILSLRASAGEKPEVPQRINDKPPIHWKENDGWKRHPQTAEEWNWHDDHYGEGSRRSELRLNFAGDLADPHAPDQMAQILRIDLLRIMARMQSAEAYKKSRVAAENQPVAPTLPGEEK